MQANVNEIEINGVAYVPRHSVAVIPETIDNWVIVRSKNAGVFMGEIHARNQQEVTLSNARRLWYWDGACSLSQLAMEGTAKPENCKFAMPVRSITVFGVIEIIPVTQTAFDSISGVEAWKS